MERKKNSAYGHPKIKTIKTAKTAAKSRPSVVSGRHSVLISSSRRAATTQLLFATLRYSSLLFATLNYPQLFSVQDSPRPSQWSQWSQWSLIVCISKTYLTRHREELHLPTLLIRNHTLCNSVAIYHC